MLTSRRYCLQLLASGSLLALSGMTRAHTLDFTDIEAVRRLRVVNDGVMGGVSQSRFRHEPEGVVFEGVVSLENNGGFASVRSPVVLPAGTTFLELTTRGDGKRYKLTLRTDLSARAALYECDFVASTDWQTRRFLPTEFRTTFRGRVVEAPPLVLGEAQELGLLIADKQAGPFRLQLKNVQAGSV